VLELRRFEVSLIGDIHSLHPSQLKIRSCGVNESCFPLGNNNPDGGENVTDRDVNENKLKYSSELNEPFFEYLEDILKGKDH
jgi:hypothetical protein